MASNHSKAIQARSVSAIAANRYRVPPDFLPQLADLADETNPEQVQTDFETASNLENLNFKAKFDKHLYYVKITTMRIRD